MKNDERPLRPMLRRLVPMGQDDGAAGSHGLSRLSVFGAVALAGFCLCNYGKSAFSPAPTHQTRTAASASTRPLGASFSVIAPSQAVRSLARSGYDGSDRARILGMLRRHEISLVQMPINEVDGGSGRTIQIATAGFSQTVTLNSTLKTVVLPLDHAGEVTITPQRLAPGATLATSVLTVYGLYALPTMNSSQLVTLDVIAQ